MGVQDYSLSGSTITIGDAWDRVVPISEDAKQRQQDILILVDPPYWKAAAKGNKSNYDPKIAQGASLKALIASVAKLKKAADNGARILFTNDWHPDLAKALRNAGFYVIHVIRKNGAEDEVVAFNFNPTTGDYETRPSNHQPRTFKVVNTSSDQFILSGAGDQADAGGNPDGGKPKRVKAGNKATAGTGPEGMAGGSSKGNGGFGGISGPTPGRAMERIKQSNANRGGSAPATQSGGGVTTPPPGNTLNFPTEGDSWEGWSPDEATRQALTSYLQGYADTPGTQRDVLAIMAGANNATDGAVTPETVGKALGISTLTAERTQPPFPRPPVLPKRRFNGCPPKANS